MKKEKSKKISRPLRSVFWEGERQYRPVMEGQSELYCRFSLEGVFTYVNHAYCRYFDRKSEELIGRNYLDSMSPDDRAKVRQQLSSLTQENPVTTYDQKISTPNGEARWQHWSNLALFDESGDSIEFQAIGMDITEQKHSEEALREIQKRYRAVVEDQLDLVCRYQPDTTLTFVNQPYCRHYGKKREELLGKSFLPFMSEDDKKTLLKCIKSVTPEHPVLTQVQCITKSDGTKHWQEWRRRALFDEAGRLVEFQSVGQDITERKKATEALKRSEQILRRQKRQLEQKNVALKEILEYISREKQQIKDNMITNIGGLLLPIINKLKLEVPQTNYKYIDLLERTLQQLTSSFGTKITQANLKLTPREIEICNMIKNGLSSKEIANLLHISLNTVGRYRNNIRKKVGIANKKINLISFLLDF